MQLRAGMLCADSSTSCGNSCCRCCLLRGQQQLGGAQTRPQPSANAGGENGGPPLAAVLPRSQHCCSFGRHGQGRDSGFVSGTARSHPAFASLADNIACNGSVDGSSPALALPGQPDSIPSSPFAAQRNAAEAFAAEAIEETAPPVGRRLELLVHNVSHKDMVLSLRRTRRASRTRRPGESGNVIDDVRVRVLSLARLWFSHAVLALSLQMVLPVSLLLYKIVCMCVKRTAVRCWSQRHVGALRRDRLQHILQQQCNPLQLG